MSIDHGRPFDFGRVSSDYAKYRDIYPQELYRRLRALEIGCQGQSVLDLGTGTGVLPRNLAPYGATLVSTFPQSRFVRLSCFPDPPEGISAI